MNAVTQQLSTAVNRNERNQPALFLAVAGGVAFWLAPQLTSGWGATLFSFIFACVGLALSVQSYQQRRGHRVSVAWLLSVLLLACVGLTAALWFSGRLAQGI